MGFREKSLRKKGFRGQWEEVREKKKNLLDHVGAVNALTFEIICCAAFELELHVHDTSIDDTE